jgi:hypothetical protein
LGGKKCVYCERAVELSVLFVIMHAVRVFDVVLDILACKLIPRSTSKKRQEFLVA